MKIKANMKKISKRTATFVCAVLCLATVLAVCVIPLTSCSSNKWVGESAYVELSKKGDTITAEIPISESVDKNTEVYLFGIDPWQNATELNADQLLAEAKVKKENAKAKIEVGSNLSEMLCKGYLFAKKESSGSYTPITGVYYVTEPGIAGKKDKNAESAPVKGAVGTVSQLLDLGAGSTVVTVNLSDLMCVEGGEGSIAYVWDGLTYYASRAAVEALDKKVRDYTDAGIFVYLEIVQTTPASQLPERLQSVVFDVPEGKLGYALNMTDREGASRICGMFDLLAKRYGSGGANGSASAFIIGRNANDMSNWQASGLDPEEGMLNYAKVVRSAYNILLSYNPMGKVYISLNNKWNITDAGGYNVNQMLEVFSLQINSEGDFMWHVSIEANASDVSDSSIWDDAGAEGRSDFISPSNIETLTNQLAAGRYKCAGEQRRVLLNRFVVGGTDEKARAASYAYAYYKCLANGTVDGLMYGNVSNQYAGLLPDALGNASEIATMVATVDDKSCADLSFVSSLIGEKWDRAYEKCSEDSAIRSTVRKTSGNDHSNDGIATITDFSGGNMYGFKASISAKYAELRYSEEKQSPALYAALSPSGVGDRAGVISSSLNKKSLKDAGYLGISTMIESASGNAVVTLRLSGYDKKGIEHVFVGETTVAANAWTDVYFDVEDFVEEIDEDTVTVAVMAHSNSTEGVSGLWMSEIVTEAPMKGGFPVWLIIVLIIAAAVIAGGVIFVRWFRKNYTFVKE